MRAKLILISFFSIIFSGCVIAKDYPEVIPFKINENNLNQWAEDRKEHFVIERQEIILSEGAKIIAVLQSIGSGIVKTNAYLYTCENLDCSLLSFEVLDSPNIETVVNYETAEVLFKSKDGTILSRTTHQWVEWLRNMKEESKR